MALASQSLILYGFSVDTTNQFITFSSTVPQDTAPLLATIPIGFYTLSGLMAAICTALTSADGVNTYGYTVDRTVSNGTQNRITLSTSGTHFVLFFGSGNSSNPASLIGFNPSDYTGATSYSSSASAGTAVIPDYMGYQYKDQNMMRKNFGSVNISASGLKESIVFALQQFMQVQFRWEKKCYLSTRWQPLIDWMIQQKAFEFTPEIASPTVFQQVTLEDPNKGLELEMEEMLSDTANYYQTPVLKFRIVPS